MCVWGGGEWILVTAAETGDHRERARARGGGGGRGSCDDDSDSHGCDGLIVEGDKGHAKRLLIHLLLLSPIVFLQPLFQLCVVLNGLHL